MSEACFFVHIFNREFFVVDTFLDELPEELFETSDQFETRNGETEENNSKPNELQQLLENDTANSNLSSNQIHQTANPVAMTGKDMSNPSSPALNNNTNSVPSPNLSNNAMVSPAQINTTSSTMASPQPSGPNLSAVANMNSQHHPASGPLNPTAPSNSHAMTTNSAPLTSMPQNFPGAYNAPSPQGMVNPAMLPTRMRNGPIANQNSNPMHSFGRQMTTDQANHMNNVNSLANNTMPTIKAEPNFMIGQPGMAMNQGGMAVSQGGMAVNQGGMTLGEVSFFITTDFVFSQILTESLLFIVLN